MAAAPVANLIRANYERRECPMVAIVHNDGHQHAKATTPHPERVGAARRRQPVNHSPALPPRKLSCSSPVRPALISLGRRGSRNLAARPGCMARRTEGAAVKRRPPGRHPWKQETTRMRLGLRPHGWTREAFCSTCGPVWLPMWFAVRGWLLTWCPWCHDATARGVEIVERPLVTCDGCQFFLKHPRGPGERGGCSIGHGAWRPNRPHECAWWRP